MLTPGIGSWRNADVGAPHPYGQPRSSWIDGASALSPGIDIDIGGWCTPEPASAYSTPDIGGWVHA